MFDDALIIAVFGDRAEDAATLIQCCRLQSAPRVWLLLRRRLIRIVLRHRAALLGITLVRNTLTVVLLTVALTWWNNLQFTLLDIPLARACLRRSLNHAVRQGRN